MGKCLLIDDEESYRKTLGAILDAEGHEVATAEDGPEALEVAARIRPDVLIADWRLAGDMDGLGVADRLLADHPGLQVIMITGCSSEDLLREAEVDIFRVLQKPFELDDFLAAVEDALGPQTCLA